MQPNPEGSQFPSLSSSALKELSDSKSARENTPLEPLPLSEASISKPDSEVISKWTQRPIERTPNKASRLFDLPHAPTYYPSEEEFKDPATYVASIRREAEKFGICKIVPPPSFTPRFSIKAEDFVFDSRKQQPCAAGASTRPKLNFLENLKAFHNQTNGSFKAPNLNGQLVDLHELHLEVKQRGGYSKVSKEKAWSEIGSVLDLPPNKSGSNIKLLFEKFLLPYEEYINNDKAPKSRQRKKTKLDANSAVEYDSDDCGVCHTSKSLETLIICEICEIAFHLHCLDPPLKKIPKVDFFCASCLRNREAGSGFEDGDRYSLVQFGLKADEFKKQYLSKIMAKDPKVTRLPLASMSTEDIENMVEKEFWRLVEDPHSDVTIEYGADLAGQFLGSGFPSSERQPTDPFSKNPWNLNMLPGLSSSLFSYHKEAIYGMTVPWLYVGMCFSMFCWHTEDHYAYSFNYQHWGDTKTWYGIPAAHAESFEVAFRKEAPDLFIKHPNLLSHLTTILSPKDLLRHNVPVYVIDQRAGEFILTFPRAYHAGFNHGFNFNEAVNFAPPDWLPFGLDCLARYRQLRKAPVFSHHGLLLRAATTTQDPKLAAQLVAPLEAMRSSENEIRNRVTGFTNRKAFRPLSSEHTNDLPHCLVCHAIGYFSIIGCACDESVKKVVCLDHAAELCECPLSERILYEHMTMEMFDATFIQLEEVANPLGGWLIRYQSALQNQSNPKKKVLEQLVEDACTQLREPPEEASQLNSFLSAAKKWRSQVVRLLDAYANKNGVEFMPPRELASHVQELADQIAPLGMDEDVDAFRYLARFVTGFCSAVRALESNPSATLLQGFDLQNQAALLGLRLEEADIINDLVVQLKWCEEARDLLKAPSPSKCLALLSRKPKTPSCQAQPLVDQLNKHTTIDDGLLRTVQDLLDQSKAPSFRKRPLTARIYPILSRIDVKQESNLLCSQLISAGREVDAWLTQVQGLFSQQFGNRRSLLAKLTTLHKQSQEYAPLEGIRGCICHSKDGGNAVSCRSCKVSYHLSCLRTEPPPNGYMCPICDTSKYRSFQSSRIKLKELQDIFENGKRLAFIPPELNIVSDLLEQLQVISKRVFSSQKLGWNIDGYKSLMRLLEGLYVNLEEETHTLRSLIVNHYKSQSKSFQTGSNNLTSLPPASSLIHVAENPSKPLPSKNGLPSLPPMNNGSVLSNYRGTTVNNDSSSYQSNTVQKNPTPFGITRVIGTNIPTNINRSLSHSTGAPLPSGMNRETHSNPAMSHRTPVNASNGFFSPNQTHQPSACSTPTGGSSRSSNPFSIENLLGGSVPSEQPSTSSNYQRQVPYSSGYNSNPPYPRTPSVGTNYLPPVHSSRSYSGTNEHVLPSLSRTNYRDHGPEEVSRTNTLPEPEPHRYHRANHNSDSRLTSYPLEVNQNRHLSQTMPPPTMFRPTSHQNNRQSFHTSAPQGQQPYSSPHNSHLSHQSQEPSQGFYSNNTIPPLASFPPHGNNSAQNHAYSQSHHQSSQRSVPPLESQPSHGRTSKTIIASHLQPPPPPGP